MIATTPKRLVVFGLSISSAWGNGHASTYRGLLAALAARGWQTTFFERDVPWYRANCDLAHPDCCDLRYYDAWDTAAQTAANEAIRQADAVLVGSYAGHAIAILDWLAARWRGERPLFFYDIDTPITLTALQAHGAAEYLRADQVPLFQAYFSFTGGPALEELERTWGAAHAEALYCGVDPAVYHPVSADPRFECLLGYMGTYAADRQPKLAALLLEPARALPSERFLVAGPQYPSMDLAANVRHLEHVSPADHAAFYASGRATLNLTRDAMVRYGWSPSVRLFEAAACGACIVSDRWPGLADLLIPDQEILLVDDTASALAALQTLQADPARADRIGLAARQRILAEHTYDRRAATFEQVVLAATLARSS
jgi:spore maturation protein CgeB